MHQRCGWENHDPRRLCDQAMDPDQAGEVRAHEPPPEGSDVRPHGLHLRHRASPSFLHGA